MKIIYKQLTKERLDKYLVSELGLSRTKVQFIIKMGQVLVNGKIPMVHQFLKPEDVIEFEKQKVVKLKKVKKTIQPNPKVPFKVVSRTKDYLIIEKPAGVIVHPTDQMENNTLASGLIAKYPELLKVGENPIRPGIVHRLDKEVSGLMIVPRTQEAFMYFKNLLKTRQVKKIYIALVHGAMEREEGSINLSIGRSRKKGKMAAYPATATNAKEALTHYTVKKHFDYLSLLEVSISTGRTHQIRVHLNSLNHPIIGDRLYTQKFLKRKHVNLERMFLHASELEFIDMKGKKVHYSSPLPKELKVLLKSITKEKI